jgi:hypothetical protein
MSTVLDTNQSKSNPLKTYDIILANDGVTTYCDCPGWKMSPGPDKTCSHLRAFVAGQLGTPVAVQKKMGKVTTSADLQAAVALAVATINGRK